MNSKHTPGPWAVDDDNRPGMEWNRHIVSGDNAICFMAHSDGKDPEQDEANARLIAAAPELLEELRDAVETIKAMSGKDLSCDPHEDVSAFEAAIAKATGANHG